MNIRGTGCIVDRDPGISWDMACQAHEDAGALGGPDVFRRRRRRRAAAAAGGRRARPLRRLRPGVWRAAGGRDDAL